VGHVYASFHPAPEWVISPLIEVMSGADRTELFTLAQGAHLDILRQAIDSSIYSFSHTVDGTPVVLGGVRLNLASQGSPNIVWMVASTLWLERVKKAFLRESRNELAAMRLLSPLGMQAHVDQRWRKSIRWLKWLGFTEVGSFEYKGRNGLVLELGP
jgi:hypothetical protein